MPGALPDAEPPGDLPSRRQALQQHGAMVLPVLGPALDSSTNTVFCLQLVEVERLAVEVEELAGHAHSLRAPAGAGRRARR